MNSTLAHELHVSHDGGGALAQSFAHCHAVTRAQARNFYYGMKLTPEPKRSAIYAIYTWMRAVDDLADESGAPDEKSRRIETFRRQTHAALDPAAALAEGSMWPAVRKTLVDYRIPIEYLDDMIAGQLLDQQRHGYDNFDQLYDYCYKVASVVGLVCITVWGYDGGQATRKMAERRGVALQLTNILRDLKEDATRGRVYIPADELQRFSCRTADLRTGKADDAFDRLMAFQIERARGYYEQSAPLEKHLHASCRATSWAMMRIYRDLLEKIARRPRQVLAGRVSLSPLRKALIAARATTGMHG